MNMNHKTIKLAIAGVALTLVCAGLSSCGVKDENSPGVEYMPDMYRSPSLENYGWHVLEGDTLQSSMLPVKGTIARGFIPYQYENNDAGYKLAIANLKNPLGDREKNEKAGEQLYGKYCVHCHGGSGDGDGKVGGKLPGPPPAYSSIADLTDGKIFHSITYGKGLMGAHASQLSVEERWQLVYYVHKLVGPKAGADSVKTVAAVTPTMAAHTGGAHSAETHGASK